VFSLNSLLINSSSRWTRSLMRRSHLLKNRYCATIAPMPYSRNTIANGRMRRSTTSKLPLFAEPKIWKQENTSNAHAMKMPTKDPDLNLLHSLSSSKRNSCSDFIGKVFSGSFSVIFFPSYFFVKVTDIGNAPKVN